MDVSSSREHRVRALAVLTACGSRDEGQTAQLVLLAVLLKEVAGVDRTMAAVAEALFAGTWFIWGCKVFYGYLWGLRVFCGVFWAWGVF